MSDIAKTQNAMEAFDKAHRSADQLRADLLATLALCGSDYLLNDEAHALLTQAVAIATRLTRISESLSARPFHEGGQS